ncbi:MAG TPA: hypothetical protein VK021_11760 [Flavobacteriaceae bacterium]|nr:hypothetical protein [Flavobacteriaceae bacterium]
MRNFPFFLLLFFVACSPQKKQSIEGVYSAENSDPHQLWILTDDYFSAITFKDQEYISSKGGTYEFKENELLVNTEYNDRNPSKVGEQITYQLTFEGDNFTDEKGDKFIKQPPHSQKLDGVWKISGRYNNGKFEEIGHTGSRKTIKILKDGYFQWIALEPDAKKFYGTGGGKYTFKNGKYTEEILFFSKDDSRVGVKLPFEGELIDGDWHHIGKSSKGNPFHEVWVLD